MSAEDDDFKRFSKGVGGGGYPMILFNLGGFVFLSVRYNIILGQFGFARY